MLNVIIYILSSPLTHTHTFSLSLSLSLIRIIVGAPNGTFPGGVEFNDAITEDPLNNTGLVYVCNIGCTSNRNCCKALTGTGSGNDIRLFDYEGLYSQCRPYSP